MVRLGIRTVSICIKQLEHKVHKREVSRRNVVQKDRKFNEQLYNN